MIKILNAIKQKQELCEIYGSDGSDRCSVGYIVDCDEEFFLMECVTPDGRWDGYECRMTEEITMIRRDSPYLDALKKLMPFYNFYRKEIDLNGKTVLEEVLDYLTKNKKICHIETYRDCVLNGYITEVSEGVAEISLLDHRGNANGTAYILKEDIDYISVESEDEIKLEIISK